MEAQLVEFVRGDKPSLHLPVMKHPLRKLVRLHYYPALPSCTDELLADA